MNRTTRVAAVAATSLLALSGLAACSSSDKSSGASSSSSSAAAPSSSAATPSPSASPSQSASASATASSGGSGKAKTATITIKDFKYSGASSVAPGTKITVKNTDSVAHTVTSDTSGKFDTPVAPGKSATFTAPSSAGTYKYHCTYHANMHGSLKVS